MEPYYAVIADTVIAVTWAESVQQARDQIELRLLEDGDVGQDLDEIDVVRLRPADGTLILDLRT